MQDYVYDLPDADRNALTAQFLSTKKLGCNRFSCFTVEGGDPFANIARQVEREVFEQSWGNDSVTMKEEYGPYDDSSIFFMAVDVEEKIPVGVLRMIRNSPIGLKTIVDLDHAVKSPIAPKTISANEVMRHHGIDDLDTVWDAATAAISRGYRRKLSTMHVQIMRIVAIAAIRENIQHFVAVLDAPVVRAARDVLGLPLVSLADTPPFTHMAAANNQAVYANVSSLLGIGQQRNRRVGQKIRDCFSESTLPDLEQFAAR